MKTVDTVRLSPFDRLAYWICEREKIRISREAGHPGPWTDDEVLATYRFCNVRRMDDRVSRWLMIHWYEPYRNRVSQTHMLVAVAVARCFNLPHTLSYITPAIFPQDLATGPNLRLAKKLVKSLVGTGPVFNSAYIVTGEKGTDKIDSVFDTYAGQLLDGRVKLNTDSIERSVRAVRESRGLASFMAGQIVADLRWAVEGRWLDKNSWAAIGPGSQRGMNRLHGWPVNSKLTAGRFTTLLGEMMANLRDALPRSITGRLEAIDYQNCLCEYDKYCRVLADEGRPKSKFFPDPEPLP